MSHYSHQFGQVAADNELLIFDDFEMDAISPDDDFYLVLEDDDDEWTTVFPVDESPLSINQQ